MLFYLRRFPGTMEDYESVLLVKNEVFIYKIPPLTTNKGYKVTETFDGIFPCRAECDRERVQPWSAKYTLSFKKEPKHS